MLGYVLRRRVPRGLGGGDGSQAAGQCVRTDRRQGPQGSDLLPVNQMAVTGVRKGTTVMARAAKGVLSR